MTINIPYYNNKEKAFHELPRRFKYNADQALYPKIQEAISLDFKAILNLKTAQETLKLLKILQLKKEKLHTSSVSGKEYWEKWYYIDGKGEIFNGLHTGFGKLSKLNTNQKHAQWFEENLIKPIEQIIGLSQRLSDPSINFNSKALLNQDDINILKQINYFRGEDTQNTLRKCIKTIRSSLPIKPLIFQSHH